MPYTQEELKNLSFYQNLVNEDEQQYLDKKQTLSLRAAASGSAEDGSLLLRNESNEILLFEDPYQNQLLEDPSSKIVYDLKVKTLKTKEGDTIINEVLNRGFREL